MSDKIDPICIIHGKKMSEHECLYCCMCFIPLTPSECSVNTQGIKEDVCIPCAEKEKVMTEAINKAYSRPPYTKEELESKGIEWPGNKRYRTKDL